MLRLLGTAHSDAAEVSPSSRGRQSLRLAVGDQSYHTRLAFFQYFQSEKAVVILLGRLDFRGPLVLGLSEPYFLGAKDFSTTFVRKQSDKTERLYAVYF